MHAATLGGLASSFALPAGDVTGAAALLRESLPLWQQLGEGQGLTLELSRCGATLRDAGKVEVAAVIVACVKRVRAEQAFDELWASRMIEEVDAGIRGRLDGAAYAEAASRGRAMSLDDAVELALEALP